MFEPNSRRIALTLAERLQVAQRQSNAMIAIREQPATHLTRDLDLTLLTGFGGEDRFIDALPAAFPARIGMHGASPVSTGYCS